MRSEGGQTQPSSFGSLINLFLLLADCCKGLLSPSVFHGTPVEVTAYISLLCIKECSSTWNGRVPNGSDLIFSTGTRGWFWKGNLLGKNNPWCFHVYSLKEEKVNGGTYYLHAVQLISFWDALCLSQRKGKQRVTEECEVAVKVLFLQYLPKKFVLDTCSILCIL